MAKKLLKCSITITDRRFQLKATYFFLNIGCPQHADGNFRRLFQNETFRMELTWPTWTNLLAGETAAGATRARIKATTGRVGGSSGAAAIVAYLQHRRRLLQLNPSASSAIGASSSPANIVNRKSGKSWDVSSRNIDGVAADGGRYWPAKTNAFPWTKMELGFDHHVENGLRSFEEWQLFGGKKYKSHYPAWQD